MHQKQHSHFFDTIYYQWRISGVFFQVLLRPFYETIAHIETLHSTLPPTSHSHSNKDSLPAKPRLTEFIKAHTWQRANSPENAASIKQHQVV